MAMLTHLYDTRYGRVWQRDGGQLAYAPRFPPLRPDDMGDMPVATADQPVTGDATARGAE